MNPLILKDSRYSIGVCTVDMPKSIDVKNLSSYLLAIDNLKKSINKNEVFLFSLKNGITNIFLDDEIIWYEINAVEVFHHRKVINKATFYTSHYVGFYSTKIQDDQTVSIIIKPRFGDGVFNYLLSYVHGLYLPRDTAPTSLNSNNSDSLWMIAFIWKATLDKAITKSQIPKEYISNKKNLLNFKGQLKISKHIKNNLFDKSRFYCKYRKLTMNTLINQTVRYTYQLLKRRGYSNILRDIYEHDSKLQSFGVQSKEITPDIIKNISYSKLNIYYKKVMDISSLIIKNHSVTNDIHSSNSGGLSYFLDIAELWEDYLLKLLQNGFPEYHVYSPNDSGGSYLVEGNCRLIRPDILVEKNGVIVAILDAKYKWYNQIGRYADKNNSVSRDDLYQMITYLYHYAEPDNKVVGLFISPVQNSFKPPDSAVKTLTNNENHKIGVINLNIEQFNMNDEGDSPPFSLDAIHVEENSFIENIKKTLDNLK